MPGLRCEKHENSSIPALLSVALTGGLRFTTTPATPPRDGKRQNAYSRDRNRGTAVTNAMARPRILVCSALLHTPSLSEPDLLGIAVLNECAAITDEWSGTVWRVAYFGK